MATIEAPERPTRDEPLFASGAGRLIVTRAPGLREPVGLTGQQREVSPGFRFQFEGGSLRVTDDLRHAHDRFIERFGDRHAPDFYDGDGNGQFLSADDFLRRRGEETGKFWEVPYEKPPSADALEEVAALAIDGDEQALAAMYEAESAGDARDDVLHACERALTRLQEKAEE